VLVADAANHRIHKVSADGREVFTATGTLTVHWSAGVLETSGHVGGPWSFVSAGPSPVTLPISGRAAFFRARR
jgi:hypothetical protein